MLILYTQNTCTSALNSMGKRYLKGSFHVTYTSSLWQIYGINQLYDQDNRGEYTWNKKFPKSCYWDVTPLMDFFIFKSDHLSFFLWSQLGNFRADFLSVLSWE
jgi:hypothetical protein